MTIIRLLLFFALLLLLVAMLSMLILPLFIYLFVLIKCRKKKDGVMNIFHFTFSLWVHVNSLRERSTRGRCHLAAD